MIRFGTNPIAWANDDDQTLGADIPTHQILDEAGLQIGFDGIENGHRWPQDDPEALRALLAKYGLAFVSGWHSLNLLVNSVEDEKRAIQPHLDKLKHNGCTVAITCETSNSVQGLALPLSKRPTLDAPAMAAFGAKVEEIAQYCAAQGIEQRAPLVTSGPLQSAMTCLRADVPSLQQDRYLAPDIRAAAICVTDDSLAAAAGLEMSL